MTFIHNIFSSFFPATRPTVHAKSPTFSNLVVPKEYVESTNDIFNRIQPPSNGERLAKSLEKFSQSLGSDYTGSYNLTESANGIVTLKILSLRDKQRKIIPVRDTETSTVRNYRNNVSFLLKNQPIEPLQNTNPFEAIEKLASTIKQPSTQNQYETQEDTWGSAR